MKEEAKERAYLMRIVISGHQWSSVVISGHQWLEEDAEERAYLGEALGRHV